MTVQRDSDKGQGYRISEEWTSPGLLELFRSIRGVEASRERFVWLYEQNPAGRALVWTLHAGSGEAIGFTAGFPRNVWIAGKRWKALNCGDFSVDPGHRTLGPALMLRRPAKALVDAGEYALLYAHPMPAMLPVHLRVGHPQLSSMTRWTLPLRVEEFLLKRIGRGWARILAPFGDAALSAVRRLRRGIDSSRLSVRVAAEPTLEYDALDSELGQVYSVIGSRSREYLRWRFFANPDIRPLLLEMRGDADRLLGYLIAELNTPTARVHDMAVIPGLGAGVKLMHAAATMAKSAGANSLTFSTLDHFPEEAALRSAGMLKRVENMPVVAYAGHDARVKQLAEDPSSWYMTVGDRDI